MIGGSLIGEGVLEEVGKGCDRGCGDTPDKSFECTVNDVVILELASRDRRPGGNILELATLS